MRRFGGLSDLLDAPDAMVRDELIIMEIESQVRAWQQEQAARGTR